MEKNMKYDIKQKRINYLVGCNNELMRKLERYEKENRIDDNTILKDITPKTNRFGWLIEDLVEIQTIIKDIGIAK